MAADIAAATGLSDPDFGVLTRLVEIGAGRLRQNQLAESMGFSRSRLSHHLSRMEDRGLVTRQRSGAGIEIVITPPGRKAVSRARPIHAASVRARLIEPLSDPSAKEFLEALLRIASRGPEEID